MCTCVRLCVCVRGVKEDVVSCGEKLQVPARVRPGAEARTVLRQYTRVEEQLGLDVLRGQSEVSGHHRRVGGRRCLHRTSTQ